MNRTESAEKNFSNYQKAEKLKQTGLSTREACAKAGVSLSVYGYYRYAKDSRAAKKQQDDTKVMITSLPENPKRPYAKRQPKAAGKLAVIIGTSSEVLDVLNEYL